MRRRVALIDRIKLSIGLLLIGGLGFLCRYAYAGDYHQNDSAHVLTYTIIDTSGNPVAGETVRVTLWRPHDNKYFDWSDNSWKLIGSVTTLSKTLGENATGGLYYTTISNDNGALISADIVCVVSNESATYSDHQATSISFDRLEKIVKINR